MSYTERKSSFTTCTKTCNAIDTQLFELNDSDISSDDRLKFLLYFLNIILSSANKATIHKRRYRIKRKHKPKTMLLGQLVAVAAKNITHKPIANIAA